MSTQWHYADRNQQQCGPVDAAWLQAAYGRGEVNATTLVWREGLSGWEPLASVAGELGIAVSAAAPPRLSTARPGVVVAQPRSSTPAWVIVGIAIAIGGTAILGILLAIAIPAYQDYTLRAKVAEAMNQAAQAKLLLAEFVLEHERCPSNDDEGFSAPTSYAKAALQAIHVHAPADLPENCALELKLYGVRPGQEDNLWIIQGDDAGEWFYRSSIPARFLPVSVRNQLDGQS